MNFTLETNSVATWDGWLVDLNENTLTPLWSQPQPITEPKNVTKSAELAVSGRVGILSTFTTPTQGITCSNWTTIPTGTP
jgi:hypothetical protein